MADILTNSNERYYYYDFKSLVLKRINCGAVANRWSGHSIFHQIQAVVG